MLSHTVWGQAFCGLRDPVAMISKLYPDYESYRSIVKTVDEKTKQQVATYLPGMLLHFGEIGRHTLYVIQEKGSPVGLVHMRSEQSQWGLVEVAWGINFDFSIHNFAFQRCRSPDKTKVETQSVQQFFQKKERLMLREFYDFTNNQPTADYFSEIGVENELAHVVLKCALKTLLVTELVWKESINNIPWPKEVGGL